ncbi:MAG: response regulator [Arcticibacter sp.]
MRKVFIIDDDVIHQRIAQIMIEKHHTYDSISSYTEASKALTFLQENISSLSELPDVILLDLNMPVMDGWDFLEEFKTFESKLAKKINIYIVSSSVDENDKVRAATFSSVKGFVSKPLSPIILKELS